MKKELIQTLTSDFESYAQHTVSGIEFWLARDLQHLLGYTKWDNFSQVLSKAKTACEVSGHHISDHFADVGKTIKMPKGATKELSDTIQELTGGGKNFGLIRSKGDQALFGKSTQAMKQTWDVPDKRPLADFAPTIILKAKDFATEITIHNARSHTMGSESAISQEHVTNNQAVRDTLLSRGITPEDLPPAEDAEKVKRRLASDERKSLKKPDSLDN